LSFCISRVMALAATHRDDYDTPPPQVRPHCACYVFGRLAQRGRWLSRTRHRRSDKSRCSDSARCLSGDGGDCLVCHRFVEPRFAANRACHVTWHDVGFVPALLGLGESFCNHLRDDRFDVASAANWPFGTRSRGDDIDQGRTRRTTNPTRGQCRCRRVGVARGHDTVSVQTRGA
jgi:hypothetical protein